MQKITWPAVALVLIACAFLFGIYVAIPADQPQQRSALLGLVLLAGQAVVGFVSSRGNHEVTERLSSLEDTVKKDPADG